MDNFNWQRAAITNGTFTGWGLRPEKTVQLIAADDIGAITELVFAHLEDYPGKTLELAGDELTEPQIAATLGQVIG
ncbi:MAG TPA: NmrA family NAD(P)-binding protein, partial [Anaerolineales bacterium]